MLVIFVHLLASYLLYFIAFFYNEKLTSRSPSIDVDWESLPSEIIFRSVSPVDEEQCKNISIRDEIPPRSNIQ